MHPMEYIVIDYLTVYRTVSPTEGRPIVSNEMRKLYQIVLGFESEIYSLFQNKSSGTFS
jgi:hypothetical protein